MLHFIKTGILMKKSITALTVMSLTLQASDNFSQDLNQIKNPETPNGGSLTFVKDVFLSDDVDNSGNVSFGDILTYQIDANNTTIGASGAFLSDDIDLNTSLVVGSVVTDQGTIISGNSLGDVNVSINIGTIANGSNVHIEFDVLVNEIPAGESIQISNQANLTTTNVGNLVSDDPAQAGGADPTLIAAIGPPKIVPASSNIGLLALILGMLASVKLIFTRKKSNID